MVSKESVKELYKERAYAYEDKVCNKGDGWKEAIDHYDNIGKCLIQIANDLEVLDILKRKLVIEIDRDLVNLKEDKEQECDYTCIIVNKQERELLKEWLKNENRE